MNKHRRRKWGRVQMDRFDRARDRRKKACLTCGVSYGYSQLIHRGRKPQGGRG